MLGIAGCRSLDPDYACVAKDYSVTKLITDSPEVRQLLATAATQDVASDRSFRQLSSEEQIKLINAKLSHPEQYMVERQKLLDSMGQQPGVVVSGKQYFRILEESKAGCANDPVTTSNYLLVRASTGPSKGAEGWACSRDVQPTGAWVM